MRLFQVGFASFFSIPACADFRNAGDGVPYEKMLFFNGFGMTIRRCEQPPAILYTFYNIASIYSLVKK